MTRLRFLVAMLALLAAGAAAAQQAPVVLFSTSWCGYCAKARAHFASKGIDYVEHDVEQSAAANAEFKRLGGRGVPLILVGTEMLKGYSEQELDALLARAGSRP